LLNGIYVCARCSRKVGIRLSGIGDSISHGARPVCSNHLDDQVDSDQWVEELSFCQVLNDGGAAAERGHFQLLKVDSAIDAIYVYSSLCKHTSTLYTNINALHVYARCCRIDGGAVAERGHLRLLEVDSI